LTGEYQCQHVANFDMFLSPGSVAHSTAIDNMLSSNKHNMFCNTHNDKALRPCLGWISSNTVKKTILATTHFACKVYNAPKRSHSKSCFPALNVHCRNEAVATNTLWSDTPTIDNVQVFVGQQLLVTKFYPMKTDKESVNALFIDEHKTTMEIKVRKTMNYEDYESTMYSWIFVGTVGL
jgi:hypothetical protein